jgi:hypothetical protein
MNTISTVGQRLATQGKAAMYSSSVQYGKEQARIGESYLGSIQTQSPEINEKVLAGTALRASQGMERWRGQVGAANAALTALAAGVCGGPIGTALAQVGMETMFNDTITTVRDQANAGLVYTAAVRDNSQVPSQRSEAEAALRSAYGVTTARAQVGILEAFLAGQR